MRVKSNVDLRGLNDLKKAFRTKKYAKVGILGSGQSREGSDKTNAEIGLIQEFGTADGKIPARSFLRMPLENQSEQITKAVLAKKESIQKAISEGDMSYPMQQLGIAGEAAVIRAFSTNGFGQWEPNAPATIEQKGSSQPLIDTTQLRDSVTSEVADDD